MTELGLGVFLFVRPNISIRMILICLFVGIVCITMARELFFDKAALESRASARFTGTLLLTYGIFTVLRGFLILYWFPFTSMFDPNVLTIANFLASMIVGALGAFGYIMMNSQRVEHEITTTGDRLRASPKMAELPLRDF